MEGLWCIIRKTSQQSYCIFFHLGHVLAVGNIARGKPTFMSSVRRGRGPSLAVDGNRSPNAETVGGSCTVTEQESKPWWAVDLAGVERVKEVAISQRDEYGMLFGLQLDIQCMPYRMYTIRN